jgi:hypothetical protein
MIFAGIFFILMTAGFTFLIYNASKSEQKFEILKWFFIVSGVVVVGLRTLIELVKIIASMVKSIQKNLELKCGNL